MISTDRINKRNLLFENAIREAFPDDNVKVIGNKNYPSAIINDKVVLSCFVHNFSICFTDQPYNGETVLKYKLGNVPNINKEEIQQWYDDSKHREAFTIKIKGMSLRVAGYNYTDKASKEPEDKYAVFAEKGYKIYFNRENAEKIVEHKSLTEYELEIV